MSNEQFGSPRGPRKPSRARSVDDMRAWEEEEYHLYQTEQDELAEAERKRLEEEKLAEEREAAIEEMVDWFGSNFEDPAQQTPRDDGEFIYIWGGPFDANDVIGSQFGDQYDQEWIEAAVEEAQKDGIYDWAPTSDSEYHSGNEADDLAAPPEQAEIVGQATLVRRLEARLDELEGRLNEIPAAPSNLGHNQPPTDIGLPPYDENDRDELREASALARQEISASEPDVDRLSASASTFRRISGKIGHWLAQKANLAVDEAIKAAVKVGAVAVLASLLADIASDIFHLIGKVVGFQ